MMRNFLSAMLVVASCLVLAGASAAQVTYQVDISGANSAGTVNYEFLGEENIDANGDATLSGDFAVELPNGTIFEARNISADRDTNATLPGNWYKFKIPLTDNECFEHDLPLGTVLRFNARLYGNTARGVFGAPGANLGLTFGSGSRTP